MIKSGSMYPELNVNDFVVILKTDNYKVGDIITYNYEGKYLVTHRIIGKSDNCFITKGDNNNSEDQEHVKIENVKGKVILVIKRKYLKRIVIIMLIIIIMKILKKGMYNEKNN